MVSMRRSIALAVMVLLLAACSASRDVALDCDPDAVVESSFDPDRNVPGFDEARDALAILSWSRGLPVLESESDDEVVFVYVDNGLRVGAAFVTPASDGWLVDALWTCPEG